MSEPLPPPAPMRRWCLRLPAACALVALLMAPLASGDTPPWVSEEKRTAQGEGAMAVTANPHATRAAHEMLAAGGSAVDAAIAAQLVLTLVEPQSSGIGGGAFLLHHDAETGETLAYDGRETAPAAADAELFLQEGEPMDFREAVSGGLAVGVPGVVRLFERAHDHQGVLPWAELFQPAIELAREGFEVSPRLNDILQSDWAIVDHEAARAYFHTDEGEPLPVGQRLRNPALADTLHRIAEEGAEAFYTGPIAEDIVDAVQGAAHNAGRLTLEDMAGYRAEVRAPVCAPYAGHRVCSAPPPAGGFVVLQILGLLERAEGVHPPEDEVDRAHLLAEASRLAYADRARFAADPDQEPVPVAELLDSDYLDERAALVDPTQSLGEAEAGLVMEPEQAAMPRGPARPSTSHLSIVDAQGNAVSMTSSVEMPFGSGLFVRGFILNNQLTDFAFEPEDREGNPVANRVAPGKRPMSAMSPTLAFEDDALRLAVGSPGGPWIIGYTARRLALVLGEGAPLAEAVAAPNWNNRNGPTKLEEMEGSEALAEALRERGHEVSVRGMTSGVHAIWVDGDGVRHGAADPRREGTVLHVEP